MSKAIAKLAHNSALQLVGQICVPFIAIVAGLVLTNVWDMSKGFTKLQSDVQALSAIVTVATQDRYTGSQAKVDNRILQDQIDDLKKRQDRTETARATIRAQAIVRPK